MKWQTILIAVCVFFCLATNALSGEGIGPDKNKAILFKSSNKMAEEQWTTNQYSAAVETLKREIENNPRNDEAHLLLGMYYLLLGRAYLAELSFEVALQNYNYSQKWMEKVALTYQRAALAKGQKIRLAERYLKLAEEHAPGINKELAPKFFTNGKNLLTGEASSIAKSNPHFRISNLCDPTNGDRISNEYFSKGERATDAVCLKFYNAAKKYSKVNNEKNRPRSPIQSRTTERQKNPNSADKWSKRIC
jgi:tetratricopeptide (TPR) repeat protein